jgi:hypothetical protein
MFLPLPANKPYRPTIAQVVLAGAVGLTSISGCQSWFKKSKEEDSSFVKDTKRIQEVMSDPDRPRLIGEVAGMAGIEVKIYESFGLVAGLPGTGGKVKPSEQRNIMLQEMRTKGVDTPEQILDDPTTALVKVRVFGNPGFTSGKILDVGIETSTECDATDLTGGKLLEARLREMAFVGGRLRSGSDQASASGELVQLPSSYTRKNGDPRTAVIVGGGTLINNHPLSVLMATEYKHVLVVKEIEKALNKRFYFQDSYKQKFMAEGKNSAQIAITSVPKYRLDPAHFSNVILATGFNETDEERKERIQGCKRLLADRTTAKRAAAELEALGTPEAIDVLLEGLSSLDPETRFYSAYSLAYLDRKESIPVLVDIAKREAAFRPLCLTGLTVTEVDLAREYLVQLLQEREPELRFGAFLALRERSSGEPIVQGERLTKNTKLVIVPSSVPLLAPSLQENQELVLFGSTAPVKLNAKLSPTPFLTLTPERANEIRISRRAYGEIATVIVEADLTSVLRGMGSVDATYNDFVQTIDQLQNLNATPTPIVFNPRPIPGRIYNRESAKGIELMALDASTRAKPKSAWSWMKWPGALTPSAFASSKTEVKPAPADVAPMQESKQESGISMLESSKASNTSSNSIGGAGGDDLPEIDWDALK